MITKKQKKIAKEIELELLQEINNDVETGHMNGDDLLCKLLTDLGFQDVVDAYNKIKKWYA